MCSDIALINDNTSEGEGFIVHTVANSVRMYAEGSGDLQ